MRNDVTVVIRSSGERTLEFCHETLSAQVSDEAIHVINEKPFSKAVRENFRIGYESNRQWTLSVDADIILPSGTVDVMIEKAAALPSNFFMYQGYVLDKLYGRFRTGGAHLYRSEFLNTAIEYVSDETLRPESQTYGKMAERGFHYYHDSEPYGIHDFEQSYFDLYRKGYMHAKKHQSEISHFLNYWSKRMSEDSDFLVAFDGLVAGMRDKSIPETNTDYFLAKFEHYQSLTHLQEKAPLENESPAFAISLIQSEKQSDEWMTRLKNPANLITRSDRSPEVSLLQKLSWRLAKALQSMSQALFRFSNKRRI